MFYDDINSENAGIVTKHKISLQTTGELDEEVVCSILECTSQDGAIKGKKQTHRIMVFSLDMILAF